MLTFCPLPFSVCHPLYHHLWVLFVAYPWLAPTPSLPAPHNPIPSCLIPSHPIPVLSHSIPSNFIPSHLVPSSTKQPMKVSMLTASDGTRPWAQIPHPSLWMGSADPRAKGRWMRTPSNPLFPITVLQLVALWSVWEGMWHLSGLQHRRSTPPLQVANISLRFGFRSNVWLCGCGAVLGGFSCPPPAAVCSALHAPLNTPQGFFCWLFGAGALHSHSGS